MSRIIEYINPCFPDKKWFRCKIKNETYSSPHRENVEFKNGKKVSYNHDEVYEIMKDKLNTLPCFVKYNSYTSSTNVPVVVREVVEVQ